LVSADRYIDDRVVAVLASFDGGEPAGQKEKRRHQWAAQFQGGLYQGVHDLNHLWNGWDFERLQASDSIHPTSLP